MGYTAFNIELDDDGYPPHHQRRVIPSQVNAIPIHSMVEYASGYKAFQILFTAAMSGKISSTDWREMRILGARLSKYRKENNIKTVVYQQIKP